MKKNKAFILTVCCTVRGLFGAPGCMDNSYHLTRPNDTKDYHFVQCNCPCEKKYGIIARRSTCCKCQHFRDPRIMKFSLTP